MTPRNHKFIIEVTTESEINMVHLYEYLAKRIQEDGKSAYLTKKGDPITYIKDIRIFKLLPERTEVRDRKAKKRWKDE